MKRRQQYRLGMSAYKAGRYAEAVGYLTPLVTGDGGITGLMIRFYLGLSHYHIAVGLFKDRRYDEAVRHFQTAARLNSSGGSLARYLVACHVGTGRYDLAGRELEDIVRMNPDDVDSRIRFALILAKRGKPIGAIAALREGILRCPDNAELHYQLGVMLAADEELAEAERLFERAVVLDSSHLYAHEKLAQLCSVNGRHERALDYLERAHKLDPANARIALQIGLLTQSLESEGYCPDVALESWPLESGLDDSAIDALGGILTEEPDFLEAFLSLPSSEIDNEVFSALAITLERALRKYPEYADLHYHCGEIYNRLGNQGDALAHMERAVAINPRYVKALIMLAELYGKTNRWKAGVERLEEAIRSGADYPDVHCLLGELYKRGGQGGDARRAYQRALELNGDYREAREALASLPA